MKAFYEIDGHDFTQQLSEKIKKEIENQGKQYILGVDEEEYKKHLIDKYSLEPLVVDFANEEVSQPTISKRIMPADYGRMREYEAEVFTFTVKYPFTGSAVLFRVRPSNQFVMLTTDITVNEQSGIVSFSFEIFRKDPAEFRRIKDDVYRSAFSNLQNTNQIAENWSRTLPGTVTSYLQIQKQKYQQENDFFAAVNVKVNPNTSSVFTAPTIKKKVVPQPTVNKTKEFATEPMMSREMYDDVLKVIYDSGKNMEKKPALYKDKDENGLRDQFLFVLETRYDGTTATGETFNRSGKTDIILKYANDGSNLFVAECKFWHGGSEFLQAISQLFDRYLSWRDSKAALLLFVTNKDFTSVLHTIKAEIKNHPYYVKEAGQRGESSYSYLFRLPQDKDKHVHFEVIAFHYDK